MRIRFLIGLALPLFLTSCASALKKKCNATNWFEYGADVAKRGIRLNSDTFLQQCEKAEADINAGELDRGFKKGMGEYCDPNFSFRVGKRGEFLNTDLCDSNLTAPMTAQHAKGVREFCSKDNGYPFGSSGKLYNDICPADLEKDFMPEYKRGRQSYLRLSIEQKRRVIAELDRDMAQIDRDIGGKRGELRRLQNRLAIVQATPLEPNEKAKKVGDAEDDVREMNWAIDRLNGQIREKRSQQGHLTKEIEDAERELLGLGAAG